MSTSQTYFRAAILAATMIASCFINPRTARADDAPSRPVVVRLGVLFPTNSNEASSHASIGLAYEFGKSDSRFAYGIYGDFLFPSSKDVSVQSGDFYVATSAKSYGFDLGVSGRYRFHPAASATPYVGLGIGAYNSVLNFNAHDGNSEFSGNQHVTDNGIAGKFMAGAEFKSGILAEGVVQIYSDNADFTNGYKLGGFGLNLGYRL